MEKLNVAIADDNQRMVHLLGEIISRDKELELVGQADNGKDICRIIREKQPDVVLLDIYRSFCGGTGEDYRRRLSTGSGLLYYEAF